MREPRIINVRGTSGSGKSTLIRSVMDEYEHKASVSFDGRKQPLYYILQRGNKARPATDISLAEEPVRKLAILGHYESPCGGCDTIGKWMPQIVDPHIIDGEDPNSYHLTFGLVRALHGQGFDVLFEGLLISGDVRHTTALYKSGLLVNVVAINIPIEECLSSVMSRRKAAGNDKPYNEHNTREKHRLMKSCLSKLKANGVNVHDCDTRHLADLVVKDILGLLPPGQASGL